MSIQIELPLLVSRHCLPLLVLSPVAAVGVFTNSMQIAGDNTGNGLTPATA